MISKGIIVAKYNEDIKWLDGLDFNKFIYNKGKGKVGTKLPNVGNEAHTYLYHIVNNYDNLDDINIFTQGNPFDHCKDFISKVNELDKTYYYDFGCLETRAKIEKHQITRFGVKCWEFFEPQLLLDVFDKMGIKYELPLIISVSHYAIFAVGKEQIRKFPLEVYQWLLDFAVKYDKNAGYLMELIWRFMYEGE
jgi:hypothetical protein